MQFLQKYWWAIALVAVIVYLLWKSMKPKDEKESVDDYTYVNGRPVPSRPITDAAGNVPTPIELDLDNLPTRR